MNSQVGYRNRSIVAAIVAAAYAVTACSSPATSEPSSLPDSPSATGAVVRDGDAARAELGLAQGALLPEVGEVEADGTVNLAAPPIASNSANLSAASDTWKALGVDAWFIEILQAHGGVYTQRYTGVRYGNAATPSPGAASATDIPGSSGQATAASPIRVFSALFRTTQHPSGADSGTSAGDLAVAGKRDKWENLLPAPNATTVTFTVHSTGALRETTALFYNEISALASQGNPVFMSLLSDAAAPCNQLVHFNGSCPVLNPDGRVEKLIFMAAAKAINGLQPVNAATLSVPAGGLPLPSVTVVNGVPVETMLTLLFANPLATNRARGTGPSSQTVNGFQDAVDFAWQPGPEREAERVRLRLHLATTASSILFSPFSVFVAIILYACLMNALEVPPAHAGG